MSGAALQGVATLAYGFPEPASVIYPPPRQKDVATKGVQIRWQPVHDLARISVVIEQEETGLELRVNLPGSATGFAIPEGFLIGGTEYKLAVGTVSRVGNSSFVESSFRTVDTK